VTLRVPPTVSKLLMVVEPVTVNVLPPTKVKLEEVAIGLVPLPKRMSLAVIAWLPVPPLATGNIPVTLEVKSIVPLVISPLTIREEDRRPAELLCTTPAVPKLVMVGAWATVRLVMVVVANVDVPVTANVPPTVSKLLMVVEPVTASVLETLLKVKLVEVPKMLLPCPKRISLAVIFCKEMFGVVPPVEVMEPEAVTEVTVPWAVVVAITFPFWSTAKTVETKPLPRESWLMVVVANVDVPVTKAEPETVKPVVEALAKVVWPETVKILLMVVVPVMAKVLLVELKVKLLEPVVEEAAVANTTWLAAKDPESLLLKVVQSAARS